MAELLEFPDTLKESVDGGKVRVFGEEGPRLRPSPQGFTLG
jgi:hypothetical protein